MQCRRQKEKCSYCFLVKPGLLSSLHLKTDEQGALEPGKTATEVSRVGIILETPMHGKPRNCMDMHARWQGEWIAIYCLEKMKTGPGHRA